MTKKQKREEALRELGEVCGDISSIRYEKLPEIKKGCFYNLARKTRCGQEEPYGVVERIDYLLQELTDMQSKLYDIQSDLGVE